MFKICCLWQLCNFFFVQVVKCMHNVFSINIQLNIKTKHLSSQKIDRSAHSFGGQIFLQLVTNQCRPILYLLHLHCLYIFQHLHVRLLINIYFSKKHRFFYKFYFNFFFFGIFACVSFFFLLYLWLSPSFHLVVFIFSSCSS